MHVLEPHESMHSHPHYSYQQPTYDPHTYFHPLAKHHHVVEPLSHYAEPYTGKHESPYVQSHLIEKDTPYAHPHASVEETPYHHVHTFVDEPQYTHSHYVGEESHYTPRHAMIE